MNAPITLVATEYRMTAYVSNRPAASAVRTLHGWHVPLAHRCPSPGKPPQVQWLAFDSGDEAARTLVTLAQRTSVLAPAS